MKRLLLTILALTTFSTNTYATSLAGVCGADSCRANFQHLSRDEGNKLYINMDINKVYTQEEYITSKIIAHAGNSEVHLSLMVDSVPKSTVNTFGFGVDLHKKHLLGIDIGYSQQEELTGFLYWGLPVTGKFTSDGFVQITGSRVISRGNVLFNPSKNISYGYEVTLIDRDPTNTFKFKWTF